MALADLSLVTEALTRLLAKYIQHRRHYLGPNELLVTGDPPDLLTDAMSIWSVSNALSVYLYSVEEDAYHKNLPGPPGNSPPVQFQEMGLNLYYLLTAYSQSEDAIQRPYKIEQRLMSYALKALHDYSTIDANTEIISDTETETDPDSDPYVFPDSLRNNDSQNEFRLALHPVALDELNKVWTGISHPMRLSAVYQVGVVMLEAEEPKASPIPVLTPNIEVRPFQPVWIHTTESDHRFTLPGQTVERVITSPTASVPVGGLFRVLGFGFGGFGVRVFLHNPFWVMPNYDTPYVEITGWIEANTRGEQRMQLQVSSPVEGREIVPGSYQIYIQKGEAISNFSPVNIAPVFANTDDQGNSIPDIVPANGPAGTAFDIYGGPFAGTGDDIRNVEVLVGSIRLTAALPDNSGALRDPEAGEFRVTPDSTNQIEAVIPASFEKAGFYPVRVIVNGISTPLTRWFEVTV